MNTAEIHFWIIAAILVILILGFLCWPILNFNRNKGSPREAYEINVYKDQLIEIETDLERGLLSLDQGEAARTEIKRRMLAAVDRSDKQNTSTTSEPGRLILAFFSMSVPLGAILLYLTLGSPTQPDQPFAGREAKNVTLQTQQQKNLIQATNKMVKHLQSNPDDLRGWTLLARSYLSNERYADAASSFAVAYQLSGGEPDLAVDYAEALSLAKNSVVTDEAHALFMKVLEKDKTNAKARYYLGMFEAQRGNLLSALRAWINLLALSQNDAPWLPIVKEKIDQAAKELGIDAATIEPAPEVLAIAKGLQKTYEKAQTENAATPGPNTADVKAAMGMTKEDRNEMIHSMVERLAAKMKRNPKDKDGWVRLERAYRVIGETALANEAAENAATLP
jgi:cytochrome c-type biogenesis protein CcmH